MPIPADIVSVPCEYFFSESDKSIARPITSSHAPTINTSSPPEYTIVAFRFAETDPSIIYSPFSRILLIWNLKNMLNFLEKLAVLDRLVCSGLNPLIKAFPRLSTSALKTPSFLIPLEAFANSSNDDSDE